ncbi:phage antirepressor KilAC domain-containing protein [Longibaculum muris]|uniref:phage antirepressor KilAC domain-containing protein n=1 Tax=Longibaculum muris TaxID=1796628 RepID=UPI0012BA0E9A|nr:phage antirepressor KilAC domain-containing protein [Longibaculum muris]
MHIIIYLFKITKQIFKLLKSKKYTITYNQFYVSNYEKCSFNDLNSMKGRLLNQNNYKTNIAIDNSMAKCLVENIDKLNDKECFSIEECNLGQLDLMQLSNNFLEDYNNNLLSIEDTAEKLHISSKKFLFYLLRNDFIYQDSKHGYLPYQKYLMGGIFKLKPIGLLPNNIFYFEIFITLKGMKMFKMKLNLLHNYRF